MKNETHYALKNLKEDIIKRGHSCLFLKGRNISDLDLNSKGEIVPIYSIITDEFEKEGYVVVVSSVNFGINSRALSSSHPNYKDFNKIIQQYPNIRNPFNCNPGQFVAEVCTLLMNKEANFKILLILDFPELWVPQGDLGISDPEQKRIIETLVRIGNNYDIRKNGNVLILNPEAGCLPSFLENYYTPTTILFPQENEKKVFLGKLFEEFKNATVENKDFQLISKIHSGLPNLSLYEIVKGSASSQTTISIKDLNELKAKNIQELSRGKIRVLEAEGIPENLNGTYLKPCLGYLEMVSKSLKNGYSSTPIAILLYGAPGVGKTVLVKWLVKKTGLIGLELLNPKSPFVGETEINAREQQELRKRISPNISFIDEITEAFPTQRLDFDGDSGASRAVLSSLLTHLSDETFRGKSLLIATTNCPWRISDALASRFVLLPVFYPSKEDFKEILIYYLEKQKCSGKDNENIIIEIAEILYNKGAYPRDIVKILSDLKLAKPNFDLNDLKTFCENFNADHWEIIKYSDYLCLKNLQYSYFYPWKYENSPNHIRDVLNIDGTINYPELNRKIYEIKPRINL